MKLLIICLMITIVNSINPEGNRCQSHLKPISKAMKTFTLCAVSNAKPVFVCAKCEHQFKFLQTKMRELRADKDEKGVSCREYMDCDALHVIAVSYDFAKLVYKTANCFKCFEKNSKPTPALKKFMKIYREVSICFRTKTNESNYVCNHCRNLYWKMRELDIENHQEKVQLYCMDIQDAINRTHKVWNKKCQQFRRQDESNLLTSCFIMAVIAIVFYIYNRERSQRKQEHKEEATFE